MDWVPLGAVGNPAACRLPSHAPPPPITSLAFSPTLESLFLATAAVSAALAACSIARAGRCCAL